MGYTREELKAFLLKEVELIQGVIRRMAMNSFLIKGFAVLVSVVVLLGGAGVLGLAGGILLLAFWFLDAYFLWQERLYRRLYNWVIRNRLKTDEYLFDLNAYRFRGEEQSPVRIMFSLTLGWFYGAVLVLLLVYSVFMFWQG